MGDTYYQHRGESDQDFDERTFRDEIEKEAREEQERLERWPTRIEAYASGIDACLFLTIIQQAPGRPDVFIIHTAVDLSGLWFLDDTELDGPTDGSVKMTTKYLGIFSERYLSHMHRYRYGELPKPIQLFIENIQLDEDWHGHMGTRAYQSGIRVCSAKTLAELESYAGEMD